MDVADKSSQILYRSSNILPNHSYGIAEDSRPKPAASLPLKCALLYYPGEADLSSGFGGFWKNPIGVDAVLRAELPPSGLRSGGRNC
jgi:hypothetical protein